MEVFYENFKKGFWNICFFIGDNLETDIKLGYDAKIETIMVCSGVHTEKDIERLKVYPTRVVKNLRELIK